MALLHFSHIPGIQPWKKLRISVIVFAVVTLGVSIAMAIWQASGKERSMSNTATNISIGAVAFLLGI